MGKPNPAKLANFPEVEVFVLVADPDGLILDSKVGIGAGVPASTSTQASHADESAMAPCAVHQNISVCDMFTQEYYAPIITAFEAQIAFTPGSEWTGEYHLKFDCLLVSYVTCCSGNNCQPSGRVDTGGADRKSWFSCHHHAVQTIDSLAACRTLHNQAQHLVQSMGLGGRCWTADYTGMQLILASQPRMALWFHGQLCNWRRQQACGRVFMHCNISW
jgi:hypothetical protein